MRLFLIHDDDAVNLIKIFNFMGSLQLYKIELYMETIFSWKLFREYIKPDDVIISSVKESYDVLITEATTKYVYKLTSEIENILSDLSNDCYHPSFEVLKPISNSTNVHELDFNDFEYPDCYVKDLFCKFPFSDSPEQLANIMNLNVLAENLDRITYQTHISVDTSYDFNPGDSIAVITPNSLQDSLWLLSRVDTEGYKFISHKFITGSSKDLNPLESIQCCLELHSIPTKKTISALINTCQSNHDTFSKDKEYLESLSSPESKLYTSEILNEGITFMDLLWRCKSCKPVLSILFDILPALTPRYYSLCNPKLTDGKNLEIIFNLVKFFDRPNINRYPREFGHTTGFLVKNFYKLKSQQEPFKILIYLKKSLSNLLLKQPSEIQNILMVAAGTGIAPFMSFIRTQFECKPNLYLLYGCRNLNNFLYHNDIKTSIIKGFLENAFICFSRQKLSKEEMEQIKPIKYIESSRYVQHCFMNLQEIFLSFILQPESVIMICGDAKGLGPEIRKTIHTILLNYFERNNINLSNAELEAKKYFKIMKQNNRYVEELW